MFNSLRFDTSLGVPVHKNACGTMKMLLCFLSGWPVNL